METDDKFSTTHVEEAGKHGLNIEGAAEAAAIERTQTIWQALKENKKAALWSALLSMTIIMEGYDVGMSSVVIGPAIC